GPVGIFFTTTQPEVDEELANRCIVLTVDEDREQTRAIHRLQRERQTLAGVLARSERERILRLHMNAQRFLNPLLVVKRVGRIGALLGAHPGEHMGAPTVIPGGQVGGATSVGGTR
ncbi:MAG: hypothetical protein L0Y64_23875, partial [Myxococcaceae bacterium]|nr:hypothetical protein [Myxococcaceae bacterium]